MIAQNNIILKHVGAKGQICIGKEYAGKQIQISKLDDGTLLIKPGQFIPDNERWLLKDDNLHRLEQSVKWAKNHKRENNFEEIMVKLEKALEND